MSGRITHSPKRQHHCNPGWRVETDAEAAAREAAAQDHDSWFPSLPTGVRRMIEEHPWAEKGTIWTCDDCGRHWRATYPYVNVFAPTWVQTGYSNSPAPWWFWFTLGILALAIAGVLVGVSR